VKVTYLSVINQERKSHFKNGLYDYVTVTMSYNTNKIEGSTLTLSDTQSLYERNVVPTGGHKIDDIIESKNHFELVNFMLETIDESLTERLVKEFHQLLKKGTDAERYGIGQYKVFPNIAGDQKVAEPHEVPEKMERLVEGYRSLQTVGLEDILTFHHQFELIHPFQDGNGRVGRIIMLRECLRNDVFPFIISSERREEYIDGLKMFGTDKSFLVKEANLQQEVFKNIAEPFIKHYKKLAIYERNNSHER
jgi:Fic family protein